MPVKLDQALDEAAAQYGSIRCWLKDAEARGIVHGAVAVTAWHLALNIFHLLIAIAVRIEERMPSEP